MNTQRSIRDGQAGLGTHFRPAAIRMLESTISFRITAVTTTLAGSALADMIAETLLERLRADRLVDRTAWFGVRKLGPLVAGDWRYIDGIWQSRIAQREDLCCR
jgi:hypothetical protein